MSCNLNNRQRGFFYLNSSLNLRSPRTTITCAIRNKTGEKSISVYTHCVCLFFYLSSSFIRRIERRDSTDGRKLSLPHIEEPAYIVGTSGADREGKIASGLVKPRLHRFLPVSLLFAAQHVSLSSPLLSLFLLTRIRTIHCAPSFEGSPEGRRGVGRAPGRPPLPYEL